MLQSDKLASGTHGNKFCCSLKDMGSEMITFKRLATLSFPIAVNNAA